MENSEPKMGRDTPQTTYIYMGLGLVWACATAVVLTGITSDRRRLVALEPGTVTEITDVQAFQEAKNQSPLLVKFYTSECPHCTKMAKAYTDTAKALENGAVRVAAVNMDLKTNQPIGQECEVKSYPSVKLFMDGKAVDYTDFAVEEGKIKEDFRSEASFLRFIKANKADAAAEQPAGGFLSRIKQRISGCFSSTFRKMQMASAAFSLGNFALNWWKKSQAEEADGAKPAEPQPVPEPAAAPAPKAEVTEPATDAKSATAQAKVEPAASPKVGTPAAATTSSPQAEAPKTAAAEPMSLMEQIENDCEWYHLVLLGLALFFLSYWIFNHCRKEQRIPEHAPPDLEMGLAVRLPQPHLASLRPSPQISNRSSMLNQFSPPVGPVNTPPPRRSYQDLRMCIAIPHGNGMEVSV